MKYPSRYSIYEFNESQYVGFVRSCLCMLALIGLLLLLASFVNGFLLSWYEDVAFHYRVQICLKGLSWLFLLRMIWEKQYEYVRLYWEVDLHKASKKSSQFVKMLFYGYAILKGAFLLLITIALDAITIRAAVFSVTASGTRQDIFNLSVHPGIWWAIFAYVTVVYLIPVGLGTYNLIKTFLKRSKNCESPADYR